MRPAIDDDPTLEAVLYQPAGRANPFTNAVFVKNAIASGAITPPIGESASVRRSDFLVGCIVCLFVALGVGSMVAAALIGRH